MTRSTCSAHPYDELHDANGCVRPHWKVYTEHQRRVGVEAARANWTKTKRLLQENGASYNAYHQAGGGERPFRLSPIPVIISAPDWQVLASGIAQRARLLSCLLADLYGPARTLLDGSLPSELVYTNPHFLRPLHGFAQKRNHWLPLYAVDLIRGEDGRFQILEDSTQAPAGMGYALENRIVVAQSHATLMKECGVERLVGFFRLLRERLSEAAPHDRDAPRVALWTPGPYSATYFEQVFLAKYLGLTVVQGEDLTVRGDRVYLKTLGGLQGIDVLLRRVHDDFADPLELRPESTLGVPGLVQALRAGNVSLMNPLGTGLVETPALLPYLPRLCRELLHEELLLESVPTYYLGDAQQRTVALADLDSLVVKPVFPSQRADSVFVHQLGSKERESLLQRISKSPHEYVAQRFVPASRTPIVSGDHYEARALVIRCFAQAGHPQDYQVLPGGLGLVAASTSDLAVSLTHGARSKDVWVLSNEAASEEPYATAGHAPIAISRGGGDLPSRIADNLFWLGRYTERAESVARLCRVICAALLEASGNSTGRFPTPLDRLRVALLCQVRFVTPRALTSLAAPSIHECEDELFAAVGQAACGGSLVSAVGSALRVSRIVRDRLSSDTWRILSSLADLVDPLQSTLRRDSVPRLVDELNRVIITLAGFSGLAIESMTRGHAFSFLDMGRRLERAMAQVSLLRATLVGPSPDAAGLLEAVLEVADSGMTYRRRYPAGLQAAPVVDLLLADETNPRSVIFQLRTLKQHMAQLPTLVGGRSRLEQHRLILSATSQIELSDVEELCRVDDATAGCPRLDELLDRVGAILPTVSDSLSETYLYHASVARHLTHGAHEPMARRGWERAP